MLPLSLDKRHAGSNMGKTEKARLGVIQIHLERGNESPIGKQHCQECTRWIFFFFFTFYSPARDSVLLSSGFFCQSESSKRSHARFHTEDPDADEPPD